MTTETKKLAAAGIDFSPLIAELIAAFIKAGYANKIAEMFAELLDLVIARLKAAASQSEAEKAAQDIINGLFSMYPDGTSDGAGGQYDAEKRRRAAADAILQYMIDRGVEPNGI